tara:strand:- start:253 stop:531 length:279 start_codon:yes stop_codon:yes gene_type:complete
MVKKRNIQFLKNKIRYNAIKKFKGGDVVKIPSYVLDEVFKHKIDIEISHKDKIVATYSYDNLFHFIEKAETKQYNGKFRNRSIIYTLTHVRI